MADYNSSYTGAQIDAAIAKVEGIEAGADVTDTANVTAAGALMDSEVTSLSGVKTLTVPDSTTISAFGATLVDDADAATARTTLGLGSAATTASTDYATAAQGALADSAQQPPAEGAFVNGDKTKLDGIAAGAEVNTIDSDPTGVTGADAITNVISLTQAEYDAIVTPDAATLYVITG